MGHTFTRYVVPGLETAGGAALMFVPGAQPIGMSLLGSGLGQFGGEAIGGPQGQTLGGSLGGLLGGLGGGAGLGSGLSSLFGSSATAGAAGVPEYSSALEGITSPDAAGGVLGERSTTPSGSNGLFGLSSSDVSLITQVLPSLNRLLGVGATGSAVSSAPAASRPAIQFQPTTPQPRPAVVASRPVSPLQAYLASQGMFS